MDLNAYDRTKAQRIVHWFQTQTDRMIDLDQATRFDVKLLEIRLKLMNREDGVYESVRTLSPMTERQQVDFFDVLGLSLARKQQQVTASRVLFLAKSMVDPADQSMQYRLNSSLWQILSSVPYAEIDTILSEVTDPGLRLWWEAAKIYNGSLSNEAWLTNWETWQSKNSQHESTRWLPSQLPTSRVPAQSIAVLLPLSGDDAYTLASKSIRDGWLTAHFENARQISPQEQPTIRFYDTVNNNVDALVREAFTQGADVVVGPLKKESVDSVALGRDYTGDVLMLNRPSAIRDRLSDQVRHLAWSIEDEVSILAREFNAQPDARCIVLHGAEPWMLRAVQAFENQLKPPAQIIAIDLVNDLSKVTDVVGSTLGIDESNARHERLQTVLNFSIDFRPRLNQEANTLVAFIESNQLEAVLQSLRFHTDRSIRVFVTESAVRGDIPDLAEGIHFTASPWRVYESSLENAIRDRFLATSSNESFFALGIDAYRFSNLWSRMKIDQPISGSGGLYRLDSDGGIRRVPEIGIVRNGELAPQPRSTVTEDISRFL